MQSTLVSMGAKWRKLAGKDAFQAEQSGFLERSGMTYQQYYDRQMQFYMRQAARDFLTAYSWKDMIKEEAERMGIEFGAEKITKTYFITIRPDQSKITFPAFYDLVKTFVSRSCFDWFELTFEQKSTDVNNLGVGFHTHIIAKMTQRSKGEVLRDTQSTFKSCVAENCIQVDPVKTDKDLASTRKYIIEYIAKDGHKEVTQEADKVWRASLNLRSLYTDVNELVPVLSLPLSSPVGERENYHITFE